MLIFEGHQKYDIWAKISLPPSEELLNRPITIYASKVLDTMCALAQMNCYLVETVGSFWQS